MGSTTNKARLEVFIVLDYLIKETDEKHKATQTAIIKYGKEKYKYDIRRDVVGEILDDLFNLTTKYPNVLPLRMKQTSTGTQKRYYLEKNLFDYEELYRVASGIVLDSRSLVSESNYLVELLLSNLTKKYNRERLWRELETVGSTTRRYSNETLKNLKKIDRAKASNSLITFKRISNDSNPEINNIDDAETITPRVVGQLEYFDAIYAVLTLILAKLFLVH